MSEGRLPRRGRKEGEWTLIDCVQGDVRAFGVAGLLKATALEAGVWVRVLGLRRSRRGRRRFVAAWGKRRKTRQGFTSRREANKARKGKVVTPPGSAEPPKRHR